jgi:hypothetical protein
VNRLIPKLWLAAFLGVLFGLGMTYAALVQVAPVTMMQLPPQAFEASRQTTSALAAQSHSNYALLLLSVFVGILVAMPVFLLAKKRG